MKKICVLFIIAALLTGLSACASEKNRGATDRDAEELTEQVLIDHSVYELYFDVAETESVWKNITQKGDGTPLTKQLYLRCNGFTFQITGIYGAQDLDEAIASEIGYIESLTDEKHGDVIYQTAYFTESETYFAAAEYNGTAYLIEYWSDDDAGFRSFLDSLYFTDENEPALDMSLFSLSYSAPAEYEKLYWSAEENVGAGLYHKSFTWENHDAEGKGAQISVSYDGNTDVNLRKDSRLEYTEKEINGYSFQTAYSDYTKGHYYAAQVGKDCYLVSMCWQEDGNYPPFQTFLNSLHVENP